MKLKRLNKRGFSLVEVAIAMAVISIVTFTALSIIYPATDKTVEASAQSNALYFAADAIECFKATKNPSELQAALSERDGVTELAFNTSAFTAFGVPVASAEYRVDIGNCRVSFTIVVSDSDSTQEVLDYTMYIEVQDSAGNSLWSTSYLKEARFKNEN
ncbi:MAG: type II secretion system protein [Clostridia bacterium]|nr:type II secretion system protein [Clostridia bacterium]